jgi:peroxiredoxin
MKTIKTLLRGVATLALALPLFANAAAVPGQAAPDFSVKDAEGKTHALADYKGDWLVLEWFNKDCPYVKKHYGSNNMQDLQKKYADKDVKWLTIISSAQGKQGYLTAEDAVKEAKSHKLASSAPFLLDTDGKVGKAYDAKTTPHIFIINPEGVVVYAGAIDDNDSANPSVIPDSKNYVTVALDEALAGKPVSTPVSRPYGCTIKY